MSLCALMLLPDRYRRLGFDLQWCPIEDGELLEPYRENWKPVVDPSGVYVDVRELRLCERPSGANAEANHAAFQKSRDRVAAELAQYDQVESIDDVRLRPITTREEADAVLGIDRED